MLRWLIGIILGEKKNLQIPKLATLPKIGDHYSRGANWQLFRLEKIAKCLYFVLLIYPKHQVSVSANENKEISIANLMMQY